MGDTRLCKGCGEPFPVTRSGRLFCHSGCRQKWHLRRHYLLVRKPKRDAERAARPPKTRVCEVCGKTVPVAANGREGKYCGPRCRMRQFNATHGERRNRERRARRAAVKENP